MTKKFTVHQIIPDLFCRYSYTTVDPSFFELFSGKLTKLTNKVRVGVTFDLDAFLQRDDHDESTVEQEAQSEKKEDGSLKVAVSTPPDINPFSINDVLQNVLTLNIVSQ